MPGLPPDELTRRAAAIELLVLDVDGVLTNGGVIYAGEEIEIKAFHVRDGSALKWWRASGRRVAAISGRSAAAVTRRAAELGISPLVQGADDKLAALRVLLAGPGLRADQVCAIGDDLPDLPLLRNVGLGVAVANAAPEVREDAHLVTRASGGDGAVREVVETLLRAQGRWPAIVERYRSERL